MSRPAFKVIAFIAKKLEIFIIFLLLLVLARVETYSKSVFWWLREGTIITRLNNMYSNLQARISLNGLWCMVLVLVASLLLTACDEKSKSSHKKNAATSQNALVSQIFKGVVKDLKGGARLKALNGMPRSLSVGQKVFEKNLFLTEAGASVVLSVSDGSAVRIDGKSEVGLDAMRLESLKQKVSFSVHYGKLLFDVQKQVVRDEFEVRTDKVSSIVRSSAGFVENTDGLEVTSLKDGRLDVALKTDSSLVLKSGETLLANENGVVVLSLASSGTLILARAIESLAAKAAAEQGVHASKLDLNKMAASLVKFNEAYKKKADAFIKKNRLHFKPMALNEYIGKPSVTLEALFAPGSYISVLGIRDTVPESGLYKRTFEWEDSTAFGPKRFIVNCGNDEVEYVCHTWNTNFVSAKMAEVLTKANERKSQAAKDTLQQLQKLKPSVVIEGSGRERIHVLPEERDIPATLRFSVVGLMGDASKQIKKIVIKRKGAVVKVFKSEELTTNSFKFPIRLKQNRIAHFEVAVTLAKGKTIKAKKVYETYCYFENYEDGKKSNRINDMTAEEEYKNVVSKHLLKNE